DVLVVDVHTLEAVDLLHLVHHVLLQLAHAANLQDLLWDHKTICELLALHHAISALHDQVLGVRDEVLLFHPRVFIPDDDDALILLNASKVNHAIDLGDLGRVLRTASFKEFRNAWQTASNILRLNCTARDTREKLTSRHLLTFSHGDNRSWWQCVGTD